jgi:uncharacterized protein
VGRSSFSQSCTDAIRNYQHSDARQRASGVCRFDPTCSEYALQAFETRALPVAFVMTASRLLRCNPFVRRVTDDPVKRPGRRALRPGTARSWSAIMMLVGMGLLFAFGGTATADTPTGGCTGSANGRNAAGLTQDNPLKVKEHQNITAEGTTPSGKSGPNQTHVKVFLVDGIGGITSEDHAGDGDTWSSNSIKVDDYLKYGVGTYKVEVTNTGADWVCTYVGYVQLDGNPLTKPIGLAGVGLIAVGAVGGVFAPRRAASPKWEGDQVQEAYSKHSQMDTILEHGDKILDATDGTTAPSPPPDPIDRAANVVATHIQNAPSAYAVGVAVGISQDPTKLCMFGALQLLLMPLFVMPVFGASGGGGAMTAAAPGTGPVLWTERVRRRGHWILGFFSGLLFGLGATVLLWQYNVWLLNILTAIVVPVVVGILFALVAWRGRRYTITATGEATPPLPATVAATTSVPDDEPPPPAPAPATDDEPPPPAPVTDDEPPAPPPPAA